MARVRVDWEGLREIPSATTYKLPAKEAVRLRNAKYVTAFLYVWTGASGTGTLVIDSAADPNFPDGMWNTVATFAAADLATSGVVKLKNLNAVSGALDISEYLRWRITAGTTSALNFSLVLFIYDQ